jgi:hypothetical protein
MSAPVTAQADCAANAVPPIADRIEHPDVWRPVLRSLWGRIAQHDFEPDQALNFISRLARDKAWTLEFARGAVMEYRHFCFLTFSGSGVMTPSEEVDEIWHQHLTYTRDY